MFTIRTHDARTLSWWNNQRANIDVAPSYQRRGRLWSDSDKAFLIDSILNGFDIPKVYLADFTYVNTPLNEHRRPYAVIDGKQRFEAIFDFFAGRLRLNDDFEYTDGGFLRLGGLTYKDLKDKHPEIAERFENFNLTVVSVITDDEARINELFVRLNKSKPLTGAEVRNAMRGEVPGLIRQLAQHPFFTECIRFSTKRSEDLNAAGKLLLIEFRGGFVDTKRVQLDRLVQEGVQAEASGFGRAAERAMKNLARMRSVFEERDPLLSSQGMVPVYYWLARECPSGRVSELRPFLEGFDFALKANRKRIQDGSMADEELTSFDLMSRNINDAGSMLGRYHTLAKRFGLASSREALTQ